MGRELQKKKNRSSIARVRQKPKSKRVNPLGNAIIAANWNQDETLTQNYRRLGLTARLNSATGGVEKLPHLLTPAQMSESSKTRQKSQLTDKLAISNAVPTMIEPRVAKVERDTKTGKITKVLHEVDIDEQGREEVVRKKDNPLHDPLNEVEDDFVDNNEVGALDSHKNMREKGTSIVRLLEEQAMMAEQVPKKKRQQSRRERAWIQKLVDRWGENYGAMFRDRKLNPMQQTEADLKRRIEKWRAEAGGAY